MREIARRALWILRSRHEGSVVTEADHGDRLPMLHLKRAGLARRECRCPMSTLQTTTLLPDAVLLENRGDPIAVGNSVNRARDSPVDPDLHEGESFIRHRPVGRTVPG